MKVSAHITEDYEENVRDSGGVKLLSHFYTINGILRIKKSERYSANTVTYDED